MSNTISVELQPIHKDKIVLGRVLGAGTFATVYEAKVDGTTVAVKILNPGSTSHKVFTKFIDEVKMSSRKHPNLISLMGYCVDDPERPMIIFERMEKSLDDKIRDKDAPFSGGEEMDRNDFISRVEIALSVARGMAWLHGSDPCLVHRDLKPANIMFSHEGNVCVTDYGLSQLLPEMGRSRDGKNAGKGSPLWMAPEVLYSCVFDKSIDVYSFGIVLWQIMKCRNNPFPGESNLPIFKQHIADGKRPDVTGLDPNIADLCQRCWSGNPSDRPDFTSIVKFLSELRSWCIYGDRIGVDWFSDIFNGTWEMSWRDFKSRVSDKNRSDTQKFYAERAAGSGFDDDGDVDMGSKSTKMDEAYVETCYRAVRKMISSLTSSSPEQPKVMEKHIGDLYRYLKNIKPKGELCDTFWNNFLMKAWALCSHRYFFGFMSTPEAESTVKSANLGSYLLRFSSTYPGCFTITYSYLVNSIKDTNNVRIFFLEDAKQFVLDLESSAQHHLMHSDLFDFFDNPKESPFVTPINSSGLYSYVFPDETSRENPYKRSQINSFGAK